MSTVITKINADDEIFSSPEFSKDRLVFNYIECSRQRAHASFYSDKKNVIICRKKDNNSVWIWTADNKSDDKDFIIAIAKCIREFDAPDPEFYVKPEMATIFSDVYALVSCDLDYHAKDEFSLGAYKFSAQKMKCDDGVTVLRYNKKFSDALLDFYMELRDEFNWSEEKVRNKVSHFASLNTFLLLKDGNINAVCVICDDDGDCSSVRSLATKASERNKGYGTLVANIASASSEKGGKERVMLYTNIGNKSANATFKKAGFELVGTVHLIKS